MIIMTAVIVTANASAIVVSHHHHHHHHHHHSVLFWVLLVESLLIISESLPCSIKNYPSVRCVSATLLSAGTVMYLKQKMFLSILFYNNHGTLRFVTQ
jgi:hypothetical protein